MLTKFGMQVRMPNSTFQRELVVEAYTHTEAEDMARAMYQGITILGFAYEIR